MSNGEEMEKDAKNDSNDKDVNDNVDETFCMIDESSLSLLSQPLPSKEAVITELLEVEAEFECWEKLRLETCTQLRAMADSLDALENRAGMAKLMGSGGGAVAGGLTLVGGAMTIMSAGAMALPILVVGTGLGLFSGVTGGAAAVTEKVLTSREMRRVDAALASDALATQHLELRLQRLRSSVVARQVLKEAAWCGARTGSDSVKMIGLLANNGQAFTKAGADAVAAVFGDSVGKQVSRLVLQSSGRVLSGAVTVVFGGAAMLYDIYRLRKELRQLAEVGSRNGGADIRRIADELQKALDDLKDVATDGIDDDEKNENKEEVEAKEDDKKQVNVDHSESKCKEVVEDATMVKSSTL